jgi:hypothetical protein
MLRVEVKFRQIADGLQIPEGPIALGDGSVVVGEIPTGLLWRIWPNGSKEVLADINSSKAPERSAWLIRVADKMTREEYDYDEGGV